MTQPNRKENRQWTAHGAGDLWTNRFTAPAKDPNFYFEARLTGGSYKAFYQPVDGDIDKTAFLGANMMSLSFVDAIADVWDAGKWDAANASFTLAGADCLNVFT